LLSTTLIILPLSTIIFLYADILKKDNSIKIVGLTVTIVNFFISLLMFLLFDFSNIEYQFIQNIYYSTAFNIYLGVDGLSIYFIILTTLISPIVLLSS
jgi:NADH:ubiquinone oxidoreductase subunit 4 (subunit M)